jgi:hypothetical protein
MKQFERLISRLAAHRVDFIIVGGFGAYIHGSSLMTQDIDIACRMEPDNLQKLFVAVAELQPVHRLAGGKPPFTRADADRDDWKNLYLSTAWGQLDCLGEITGVGDYQKCLTVSEAIKLGAATVRIISLDALIVAKRAIARPRDLQMVLQLEALRKRPSSRQE